jgi:hypothetical protein
MLHLGTHKAWERRGRNCELWFAPLHNDLHRWEDGHPHKVSTPHIAPTRWRQSHALCNRSRSDGRLGTVLATRVKGEVSRRNKGAGGSRCKGQQVLELTSPISSGCACGRLLLRARCETSPAVLYWQRHDQLASASMRDKGRRRSAGQIRVSNGVVIFGSNSFKCIISVATLKC